MDVVRLAYGVVAGRDLGVWAPGPDSVPVSATRPGLAPGAAVVIGPRHRGGDAPDAIAGLNTLVADGGILAAGAGVLVGAGFRTARLAGADGDRRDAVLAALPVVAPDRLGERAGLLVALFGPAATRPVGTAATAALHDGRWGALHLASAASDVLGPEQLEQVLRLTGPEGLDREPDGLASQLAVHLGRLLGPVGQTRRLALLLDLWATVGAHRADAARRHRLRDVGAREDRRADVRERYQRLLDEHLEAQVRHDVDSPRPADLARWTPNPWHWQGWLNRAMHDALAATVLLRAAVAIADHGLEDGLARVRPQLATAPILITKSATHDARRTVPGLAPLPARPGVHLRDLDAALARGIHRRTAPFVRQRLARALDYGVVALESIHRLVDGFVHSGLTDLGDGWTCQHLREWREAAGYTAVRPPEAWEQPVLGDSAPPLGERLRSRPEANAAELERTGDLLWWADLADAVAQLHGHPAAQITYGQSAPTTDVDPAAPPADPLRPSEESVFRAVAGAARLIDLGAELPPRARSWAELVHGLLASAVVGQASIGLFPVPAPLVARDGVRLPGTDTRVEIAREPRQLAEWADYMGNCIAGPYYLGEARRGRSVLGALRGPDDRIVANVELRPTRTGWQVDELRARFNADPAADLSAQVEAWAAALPPRPPARPTTVYRPHRTGIHRRARRARAFGEMREALAPLAADAMGDDDVIWGLAVMSRAGIGVDTGLAGVTALRRARRHDIDAALRAGLAAGAPELLTLWRATAVRPLADAISRLDPSLRERSGYLTLLLHDEDLPTVPRRLARVPGIAEARSVELVARRLRRAIGRLARAGDPVLTPRVVGQGAPVLLCALVLTVSTAPVATTVDRLTGRGEVTVPGYPVSTLDDESGPWRRATSDALELGADLDWRLPTPALTVPTAWLGRGGWPALWAQVNRAGRYRPVHAATPAAA